ncbi:MAG TPA: hypothetical protein VF292_04125 [Rhodanobacteraceae bacterium]
MQAIEDTSAGRAPATFASKPVTHSEIWLTEAAATPIPDVPDALPAIENPQDATADAVDPALPAAAAGADPAPSNAAAALARGVVAGACKLVGADGCELVIDPERGTYHFASTLLAPLTPLLQQPANAWQPVLETDVTAIRTAASPAQSLVRLRWYAGLIATPGVLDRRLATDAGFKLLRWSPTEREFPRHFRIARAMLGGFSRTAAIGAAVGVPEPEIIDYVNASYAAGNLAMEAVSAGTAAPAPPSRTARLMAALNKPLFAH